MTDTVLLSIYGHYDWLEDEKSAQLYKQQLVEVYEKYFQEIDKQIKQKYFEQLEIYLSVVCDIIAYRYLVKHYHNLFNKLHITVEDYMKHKVERLLITIKDKKEHIEDILSYVYMSFMLSSPRLIYDYGEKIGRCQIVRKTLPYYLVARDKFFGRYVQNTMEHIIFNVDTLYLDDTDNQNLEMLHSNLDKFSYQDWENKLRTEEDGISDFNYLIEKVKKVKNKYSNKSKQYLLNLLVHWKNTEIDYFLVKNLCDINNSYSLIDYITYKFNTKSIDLTKEEFIDTLKILNLVLK